MAATRMDILRWIDQRPEDATHMIVVCDTYDWEDFPVYVTANEDVHEVEAKQLQPNGTQTTYWGGQEVTSSWSSQKIMEVYSFTGKHTIEAQMSEHRARHYD